MVYGNVGYGVLYGMVWHTWCVFTFMYGIVLTRVYLVWYYCSLSGTGMIFMVPGK